MSNIISSFVKITSIVFILSANITVADQYNRKDREKKCKEEHKECVAHCNTKVEKDEYICTSKCVEEQYYCLNDNVYKEKKK